jgi:hypothetical protein
MYLIGCMPAGYNLWPFIESVPSADFFGSPLYGNGLAEPGGNELESATVDGPDSRPITAISLNIAPPAGELPPDRAEVKFAAAGIRTQLPGTHRLWNGTMFYWQASLLNHQPLYFEDVNLERHGFTYGCWQPFVSAAKFFGTIPAMPYLAVAEPSQIPRYTLGETRPGSHAPYVRECPPLSLEGAAVEAGVVTGLFFLIP